MARLDYIESFYRRALRLDNGELYFYGTYNSGETLSVSGCSSACEVWDITDAARRPNFSVLTPAHRGQFAPGNGWQKVRFGSAAKGRYLALCAAGGHDASTVSAIAEIYALGADGQRIDRNPWKAYYTDSQTGTRTVDKVFDLQESTFWQTAEGDALPHTIVIDLGSEQTLTGLEYLPRAEAGAPGSVKGYSIYVYN